MDIFLIKQSENTFSYIFDMIIDHTIDMLLYHIPVDVTNLQFDKRGLLLSPDVKVLHLDRADGMLLSPFLIFLHRWIASSNLKLSPDSGIAPAFFDPSIASSRSDNFHNHDRSRLGIQPDHCLFKMKPPETGPNSSWRQLCVVYYQTGTPDAVLTQSAAVSKNFPPPDLSVHTLLYPVTAAE